MYKLADKTAEYLDDVLIELFARLKALTKHDELNVFNSVNSIYDTFVEEMKIAYLLLARHKYKEERLLSDLESLSEEWLDDVLSAYDPTTKVVFINELERKFDRLKEAMIASPTPEKEVDAALKSVSLMVRNYTIKVTDEAVLQAIKDDGEHLVQWIAEIDSRTCEICLDRDRQIYTLKDLPPKPHINCRCMFRRVK